MLSWQHPKCSTSFIWHEVPEPTLTPPRMGNVAEEFLLTAQGENFLQDFNCMSRVLQFGIFCQDEFRALNIYFFLDIANVRVENDFSIFLKIPIYKTGWKRFCHIRSMELSFLRIIFH